VLVATNATGLHAEFVRDVDVLIDESPITLVPANEQRPNFHQREFASGDVAEIRGECAPRPEGATLEAKVLLFAGGYLGARGDHTGRGPCRTHSRRWIEQGDPKVRASQTKCAGESNDASADHECAFF
jgi:hypothetical protein